MASKYQDALIATLQTLEPEDQVESNGETFKRYQVESEAVVGAILCEGEDGTITAEFFEDPDDLEDVWAELQDGDDEDGDDDDDE